MIRSISNQGVQAYLPQTARDQKAACHVRDFAHRAYLAQRFRCQPRASSQRTASEITMA